MLYLEDFLELIEQLPDELRTRFTDLRVQDLQMQNDKDRCDMQIEQYFKAFSSLNQEQRESERAKIKNEFGRQLAQSDEKIALANTMYELVVRYQRKLDEEVTKFKLELEADNPGISATLEQNVRDADHAQRAFRKERRRRQKLAEEARSRRESMAAEAANLSPDSSAEALPLNNNNSRPTTSPLSPLGQQPRRAQTFPSRLSDIRALNSPVLSLAVAPPTPAQASPSTMPSFSGAESRHGRPRKLTSRVQEMLKETMQRQRAPAATIADDDDDDDEEEEEDEEEDEDTNDEVEHDTRTWCICNKASYGEMVACDNASCPFEWFHYQCVGISQPPKGKWFCPHCVDRMKRRRI